MTRTSTNGRTATKPPRIIGGQAVGADAGDVARFALSKLREEQPAWAATPLSERLAVVKRFRRLVADRPERLTDAVDLPMRRGPAETLAAEVLPLCEAAKFLERNATELLGPTALPRRDRPAWLYGVQVTEHRDPHGVVLVLGTWNYPLFLPGTQTLQALAAGNAVLLKPGENSRPAAAALRDALIEAGLPAGLLAVLPEEVAAATAALDAGVDKVVLTGAADTGRAVLHRCADTLTPASLELSGCDAVFVRHDADVDLAVRCLTLGMLLNGSATCVAPRRVFVHDRLHDELASKLSDAVSTVLPIAVKPQAAQMLDWLSRAALRGGARRLCGTVDLRSEPPRVMPLVLTDVPADAAVLGADLFAPVLSLIRVTGDEQALGLDARCPYALGATVFGADPGAKHFAARVNAGCVVVNDFLVPTADPRVAFGGRGESGFGVTRGAAGLLAMTRPKAVIRQTSNWRPHLDPTTDADVPFFRKYLAAAHGSGWMPRLRSGLSFARDCFDRRRADRGRTQARETVEERDA